MSTTMETMTTETRCPTRFSTYSMTPTLAPSIAPSRLSHISTSTSSSSTTTHLKEPSGSSSSRPKASPSPMATDLKHLQTSFARMDDPQLQRQRYDASELKREEISKLALGAKIDKALGRRMTGQDATFKVKEGKKLEVLHFGDDKEEEMTAIPILPLIDLGASQEPFVYDEHSIGVAR